MKKISILCAIALASLLSYQTSLAQEPYKVYFKNTNNHPLDVTYSIEIMNRPYITGEDDTSWPMKVKVPAHQEAMLELPKVGASAGQAIRVWVESYSTKLDGLGFYKVPFVSGHCVLESRADNSGSGRETFVFRQDENGLWHSNCIASVG